MAFRRTDTIASRSKLFYQQRHRFASSYSPTHRDDSDREDSRADPIPRRPATSGCFRHRFCVTGRSIFSAFTRPGNALGDRRFAFPADRGVVFGRHFSSGGNFGDGGATDKDVVLTDTSGVAADKALEAVPVLSDQVVNPYVCEVAVVAAEPVLSVVAAAAADSCLPLAAVQYLIGYVHVYTGLDWWASIALTALFIRSLQLPWLLKEEKNPTITTTTPTTITTTDLATGRVKIWLKANDKEKKDQDLNTTVVEGQAIKEKPYREYDYSFRSTWSDDSIIIRRSIRIPIISAAIFAGSIFAVDNMAEKVPSFKEGGMFWFTDLSTPDSMYIFPVLASLTFWITMKCRGQGSMEFNSAAGTINAVSKAFAFAALTIPFTASFPKAVFCYWITSNLFSLAHVLANRNIDNIRGTFFKQ